MSQETSTLVVAVDSTGVLKATAELDRLTAASARAEAATGKLGGTNAAASTGMGKAAEAATKLSASENAAAAKTAEVAAASTAATKALDAQAAAQTKAAAAADAATAAQARQMGRALGSALTGNTGALKGAAVNGVLAAAGSAGAATLAVAGLSAALVAMGASYAMAAHASDEFTRATISVGAGATTTAGELRDMVEAVGDETGSYGKAQKAMLALAQTGDYSRAQLGGLTQTAVEFADMTGGKLADGVQFVNRLMNASVSQIVALDSQYHFLTASQLEHIRALESEGNADQARAEAMRAASQAVHDRALEVKDSVSIMAKAWEGLTSAVSGAWNAMKQSAGPQTLSMQLASAMKALDAAQGTHFNNAQQLVPNASPEEITRLQQQVNALRAQVVQQGFTQTQAAVNAGAESRAKTANAYLDQFKTPLQTYTDALSKAASARHDALLAPSLTTEERADIESHYQQAASIALQAYESALTKGAKKARAPLEDPADKAHQRAITELQKEVEAEGKLMDQRAKQDAAAKSYADSLSQQAATQKAQLDLQLQSVGMSDREIQQAQALLQLREEYNRAVQSINSQRAAVLAVNPKADVSGFDSEIAAQKLNLDTQTAQQKDYYANLLELEGDWRLGAERGMKQFMDSAANVAGQTEMLFQDAFSGLSDSLVNFVTTGKLNFKDLADSIISDLVRMETRILISQALTAIFGSVSGTSIASNYMAGGGSTYAASGVDWSVNLSGGRASGGPVAGGSLYEVAEGGKPEVLSSGGRTYLLMGAQDGYVTPASTSGTSPLGRAGSAGTAQTKSGGTTVIVENHSDSQAQVQQSKDGNGNDLIRVVVGAAMNEWNSQVQRGGQSYKTLQQVFGLNRRGVPVAG